MKRIFWVMVMPMVLVLGPAGPAWADDEAGVSPYPRGDYETAF